MNLAEGLLKFQPVPVNCPNWDFLGQVSDSKGLVKLHVLCIITLGSEYQIHHDVYVIRFKGLDNFHDTTVSSCRPFLTWHVRSSNRAVKLLVLVTVSV